MSNFVLPCTTKPPVTVLAYASAASEILPVHFRVDRCLNASWIFVEVMRRFGFSGAKALSVFIDVMNPAYYARSQAKSSAEAREWEARGAYAVFVDGIAPAWAPPGWAGHVVGTVQNWLVDSAVSQFSRPERGIDVPELLVTDASSRFLKGKDSVLVMSADGCAIRYRARTNDHAFAKLPGFRNDHPGNRMAADEIEGAMRGLIGDIGARRAG